MATMTRNGRRWQARGYAGWGWRRVRIHLGHFDTREEALAVERQHRAFRQDARARRSK